MLSSAVISVKNITKTFRIYNRPQDRFKQALYGNRKTLYREHVALKNITLAINHGETVGIVGRNGSGKSTLLQIIAGTLAPSSGNVEVNGRIAALLELGSGFNPDFTGRENVYMNGAILGLSTNEIDDLLDEIVRFADIGEFFDQPVKTYSSGMAVRLAFAVQVVVPKEILIVDEALAVGDELFQRKCFAKIEEFKRSGGTILFVSHSGSAIVELCDRAVLLDEGELILVGTSKQVVNFYQKLIYAPAEKRSKIHREINQFNQNESKEVYFNDPLRKDKVLDDGVSELVGFDPNLRPHSTLRYESQGARIYDPKISDLTGKQVNILQSNQKYLWSYKVKFESTCRNVRFGMLIKTGVGLEVGGASSSKIGHGIDEVHAGDIYKVEFSFHPRLAPGVYFLNAGLLGIVGDDEIYLDRGIDIAAFKIMPQENSLMTAIVNFEIEPYFMKTEDDKEI